MVKMFYVLLDSTKSRDNCSMSADCFQNKLTDSFVKFEGKYSIAGYICGCKIRQFKAKCTKKFVETYFGRWKVVHKSS